MAGYPPVRVLGVRLVFNCLTCGTLCSVDTGFQMNTECANCGARYTLANPDINLTRVTFGRHPSLWYSNNFDGQHDPLPVTQPQVAMPTSNPSIPSLQQLAQEGRPSGIPNQ